MEGWSFLIRMASYIFRLVESYSLPKTGTLNGEPHESLCENTALRGLL